MGALKGSYLLVLEIQSATQIRIGKLGSIQFDSGYYIYTGSGMNSLEKRLKRHFTDNKKLWWHIDYLTINAQPLYALAIPHKKLECSLAGEISAIFSQVKGFGCSDCKCTSHLFYAPGDPGKTIFKVLKDLDLDSKNIIYYTKDNL